MPGPVALYVLNLPSLVSVYLRVNILNQELPNLASRPNVLMGRDLPK